MRKLAYIFGITLFFFGCSVIKESPYPLLPVPIFSFAPEVPILPETQNTLSGQLQEDIDKNIHEGSIMAMRGGRGIIVKNRNQRE